MEKLKKISFYIVLVLTVVLLVFYIMDIVTHYRYESVVKDELGVDYSLVDCRATEDVGVRVCFALNTEEDVEGYAVRLSNDQLFIKKNMDYETFKEIRNAVH